jgi:hypothetical protein
LRERNALAQAKHRYLVMSCIAVLVYAVLIIICTMKFAQAPQLGVGQFLWPALLWGALIWIIWDLRKWYHRLDERALERYKLK